MPRGVPKNGTRRTRSLAAEQVAEATEPAVAVYDAEAGDLAAGVEEAPAPTPPVELTPEQLEIKALRDRLAKSEGRKDFEPEPDETPADGETIIIHFLEDGLTALGRVMYRGDELEFVVGSPAHKDTYNRLGQSWLDLRFDEFAQVDRWDKVMFRSGPWPGKTYRDGSFEPMRGEREGSKVGPPTEAEIAAAEKARLKRAAPRLPQNV